MSRFSVIYDACVLYPAPLRDLLIELATTQLFQARWTDKIHDEWIENLLVKRKDLERKSLERTKRLMNDAVEDSLVVGYEYLIDSITLEDKDDRHVVAAAIHARADAIVTFNLQDFPKEELENYRLEAIHPDDFIRYQFDINLPSVLVSARRCRTRLKREPVDAERYLEILRAQSLPKTADELGKYVQII